MKQVHVLSIRSNALLTYKHWSSIIQLILMLSQVKYTMVPRFTLILILTHLFHVSCSGLRICIRNRETTLTMSSGRREWSNCSSSWHPTTSRDICDFLVNRNDSTRTLQCEVNVILKMSMNIYDIVLNMHKINYGCACTCVSHGTCRACLMMLMGRGSLARQPLLLKKSERVWWMELLPFVSGTVYNLTNGIVVSSHMTMLTYACGGNKICK